MPRVKPTEIRLVSSMLLKPAEDADSLAESIILALDEKRQKDERWMVIYQWQPKEERFVTITYGPFNTRKQAEKALGGLVSPGEPLAKGMVCKVAELPA
jgi:hypothetical protein